MPRARLRASQGPLTGVRVCEEREAGAGPAEAAGAAGPDEGGGRGQLQYCCDYKRSEFQGPRGAMLWFQGAIPAAIASAKRSGAVFVVFVAGEVGGGFEMRLGHPPWAYFRPVLCLRRRSFLLDTLAYAA